NLLERWDRRQRVIGAACAERTRDVPGAARSPRVSRVRAHRRLARGRGEPAIGGPRETVAAAHIAPAGSKWPGPDGTARATMARRRADRARSAAAAVPVRPGRPSEKLNSLSNFR